MSSQTGTPQQLVVPDAQQLRRELDLADPSGAPAEAPADPKLAQQAEDVVARILRVDLSDHDAREQTKSAVEAMGINLQREAARRSQMLKQPLQQMMKSGEEGGAVASSLIDLKLKVEELDPAKVDLEPGGLLR